MAATLFEFLPDRAELPHVDLGTFPTPVQRYDELGATLGVPDLYVKRDGQSGELYGGNKVRKLEFLLGDAQRRNCTTVWTGGGIGSNHVLATCLYARAQSLRPQIVHFPQPVTDHVRENLRAVSTTDPYLKLVSSEPRAAAEAVRLKATRWLHPNPSFYYIPPGGASPVGELGYVNAAFELREQIDAGELPEPDVIAVAVGSGGTLAGLLVGCRLASIQSKLLGVRVSGRLLANSYRVARLANRTADLLTAHGVPDSPTFAAEDVTIIDGYVGDGYGEVTPEARRAKRTAADCGLELDLTYTGKALAGLRGERNAHALDQQTVLYLHTYNETDISDRAEAATPSDDLPAAYQRFFAGEPA